jgi:GTP-binding protein
VNDKEKMKWLDTTQQFLTRRESLKKVFLLIDASISPQKIDGAMIESLVAEKVDFAIVFTKIDKGTQKERHKTIETYKKWCQHYFLVSNTTGKGRNEVLDYIETLL